MNRSRIAATAALMLMTGSVVCYGGPCTTQIAEVEKQIRLAEASSPPGGAGAPSGPQSVGAQLHHQPTPSSVQSAEQKASADAEAALNRAKNADAAGDAEGCAKALREAKDIYGIE